VKKLGDFFKLGVKFVTLQLTSAPCF